MLAIDIKPHRDGGQSQYVSAPVHRRDKKGGLARLLEWAQANLNRELTVDALAAQARMSSRSFARHFRAETGTTPHRWLTHQRLLAAQHWLEASDGLSIALPMPSACARRRP
jgi:AraC family transcriptional regulator, transcriptional activator FtrA